ncbi:MAG: hypothetical protein LBB38_02875 [Puniceicoccales bacterium]|jgi:hypothetical protein|nr:hypothetical protein [Puniceicoccales bacterium]
MVTELEKFEISDHRVGSDRTEQKLPDSGRNDPSAGDAEKFRDALEKNAHCDKTKRRNDLLPINLQVDLGESLCMMVPQCAFAAAATCSVRAPEAKSAVRHGTFDEIVAKLVDRIIASESVISAGKKVNILLKDPLLAGTQVQLSRNGSALTVAFLTANDTQMETIVKNQETLRAALIGRTKFNDVEINVGEEGNGANLFGGSGGRSKGEYFSEDDGEDANGWRSSPTARGRI